jgi:hypothetical protein
MEKTQEEKLQICDKCPYMELSGEGTIFGEERNDMYCTLFNSLIRPCLHLSCPDNRW